MSTVSLAINDDGSIRVPWQFVSGVEMVRQRIMARLRTRRGTVLTRPTLGVDYLAGDREGRLTDESIGDEVHSIIRETVGVEAVTSWSADWSPVTRALAISVSVRVASELVPAGQDRNLTLTVNAAPMVGLQVLGRGPGRHIG